MEWSFRLHRGIQAMHVRIVWLMVLFFAASGIQAGFAQDNEDCMVCHGDPGFTKTLPDGSTSSLYIDEDVYKHSVHGDGACTSCHDDITELPHGPTLKPVACGGCHDEAQVYETSLHAQALHRGEHGAASCDDCHGSHDIRRSSDPASKSHPRNLPDTCGKCHSDPALVKSHMISVMNPSDSYMKSAHFKAISSGNGHAATCTRCHGTHDLQPSNNPASKIYRSNISQTCGQCHSAELAEFEQSIHGKALAAGIKDAPTCVDCHAEHDIEPPGQRTSKVNRHEIVRSTCTRCHDDVNVMRRYGLETGRQASYMDSYHGLASAAGSEVVANCASCHGNHLILPHADPASSTHKDNLPKTCGQCHENAGPNFAVGAVHIMPTSPDQKALGIVRIIYIFLIVAVIGGMVFHNTIMMMRHMTVKLFEEWRGSNTYRRFTTGMTMGHLVLTIAFIVLSVSGFALRYPESWWARHLFYGDAGLAARGVIHRGAALVLVAIAVVNASYLLFTKGGRKELRYLMFGLRDITGVFQNLAYAVGLRKEGPRFDRYSYIEKFEYWGMWWGTALMIVTGFSMWFVNTFLKFFPKIALDIVALIHFYEAWLAVLTIVVWHLYYMIFDPHTYPMNWSWITGRITHDDLKHRHPLEYEREVLGKPSGTDNP